MGFAASLVAWGRLASLTLDPPGPRAADWAANLIRSLEFQIGCVVALLLLGALVRRAWMPAAGFAVVVAVVVAAPLFHGVGPDRGSAPDDAVRALSINVLVHNTDVASTVDRIRDSDADIVLVQEYGKAWSRQLPSELGEEWRLVVAEPRDDSFGVAAFVRGGRFPSIEGEAFAIGEFDLPQLRLETSGDDGTFVFYGVHVQPPISPRGFELAAEEVRDLRRRIRAEDAPVLVAGDFNAVGGSAIDRSMRDAGLHDAWDVVGTGAGWTWPRNGVLRHVPGVRIDHLYYEAPWSVHEARTLDSGSSDHRPLLVVLSLRS